MRTRLVTAVLLAGAAACDAAATSSNSAATLAANPPKPTTTLPTRSAQASAPGLCSAWASAQVDLTTLGAAVTDSADQGVFAHGTPTGIGLLRGGTLGMVGLRIAPDGSVETVQMPGEQATLPKDAEVLANGIATADGGWLAGWTDQPYSDTGVGKLYFVHYDASGNPVARSSANDAGEYVMLGNQPNGDVLVAWDAGFQNRVATLPIGALTAFPAGTLFGAAGNQTNDYAGDFPQGIAGGRVFGLYYAGSSSQDPPRYRAWDPTGAEVVDTRLTMRPTTGVTMGVASDASAAIFTMYAWVDFEDPSLTTFVPVDLDLGGGVVGSTAGAVVATTSNAEAPDGGALGLSLFEVTRAGARSPIAQVPLPDTPLVAGANAVATTITASLDGQTYFVMFGGEGRLYGAVFHCTERGS